MTLLNALGEVSAHLEDVPGAVMELTHAAIPGDANAGFSESTLEIDNGTTGVFYTAGAVPEALGQAELTGEGLAIASVEDDHDFELLEKRFWALMRVLVNKGLVTREEFLTEMARIQ
jgi:hypothetical protein